jgi:hypothetical protein
MRVVMGGMACRHDLPLDGLDDVELAVETLLAEESVEGGDLALTVWCDAATFKVRLDGLTNQSLRTVLVAPLDPFRPSSSCRLDVRVFLDALVDRYQVVGEAGGVFAVEMEKRAR